MGAITAHQALTLLAWFLIAAILGLMLMMARHYQKHMGRSMLYRAFVVPVILFGAASVRGAFINQVGGDLISDLLWTLGGLTLLGLGALLYIKMSR